MSHLIEEYAKNLGVKISKPMVAKKFWPVIFDNYITICLEPNIPAKQYRYYNLVVDMVGKFVRPLGIKIIQIGSSKSTPLDGVDGRYLDMDFKNLAYIVSKAKLHVGVDDVLSHYASSINLPQVTIFANVYPSVTCGYWSKNQTKVEAPWKVKPCLNITDQNDTINKIKPETIATAILNQLKIKPYPLIATEFIGDYFDTKVVEIVPDFFEEVVEFKNIHAFLRPDYGLDTQSFFSWCDYLSNYSIFSREAISLEVLSRFSGKLKGVSYIVDKNSEFSPQYLKSIGSMNISVTLLAENEEDLPFLRNKYFDYDVHPYLKANKETLEVDLKNTKNLYFSSSKTIISKGKKYPSKYHFEKGQNIIDKNFNLEDNDDLLQELNHFYVYTRNTN